MTTNVTSSDSGIDTAETSVERSDARNSRITTTANSRPRSPSVARPSMDSSMNGAWSNTTSTRTSWASSTPARSSTASCTACDTSTVLPAGVLVIATASAASPSRREYDVAGSGPAVTVATSPSVTGAEAPGTTSGSAARSSTVVIAVPTCTLSVRSPSATVPAGSTTPLSWRSGETAAGRDGGAAPLARRRGAVGARARREHDAVVLEDRGDLRGAQARGGQRGGVEVDRHLLVGATAHGDAADAADVLERGHEARRDGVREPCLVRAAGHGELDDREVVHRPRHDLRLDVLGQLRLQPGDRRLQLRGRRVHVGAVRELHGRHGQAGRRRRRDLLDTLDGACGRLDGDRDLLLDDRRRRPGVRADDGGRRDLQARDELLL